MTTYTLGDIQRYFDADTYKRGFAYARAGDVLESFWDDDGSLVARVQGSKRYPYEVSVKVLQNSSKNIVFRTECSCPVGAKCKHAVAALVNALHRQVSTSTKQANFGNETYKAPPREVVAYTPSPPTLDYETEKWLKELEKSSQEPNSYPPTASKRILYLLSADARTHETKVSLASVTLKTSGVFGSIKPYQIHQEFASNKPLFVLDEDIAIMKQIQRFMGYGYADECTIPCNSEGEFLLEAMLATGRCYWKTAENNTQLHLTQPRNASLEWQVENDGKQCLQAKIEAENSENLPILRLLPPCFVDIENHTIGKLNFEGVSAKQAVALMSAPALNPEQVKLVSSRLPKTIAEKPQLMPKNLVIRRQENVTPTPILRLDATQIKPFIINNWGHRSQGAAITIPVAKLNFDYAGRKVAHGDKTQELTSYKDGELISMERNLSAESKAIKTMRKNGFYMQLADLGKYFAIDEADKQLFSFGQTKPDFYENPDFEDDWVEFVTDNVPQLRGDGWEVEISKKFPLNIVKADDEWYAEVGEGSGIDWFGLEMGVTVEGQRQNLLPILLNMLKNNADIETFASDDPTSLLLVPMPDGRKLALPRQRAYSLLKTLHELYSFQEVGEDGKLKMQAIEAALLAEMESASAALNMRWFGGDKVRNLGKKLQEFSGIQEVLPPKNFKAELRGYQQQGLNWLQFLREYELAGILADDMGLGKTVQALAHIATEKAAGRLTSPILVIAPTSLMANWRMEAEKFAPKLKVLTLHGSERKELFGQIMKHDIVLTTYPLLPRDKDALLANNYHTVILDEAQTIKNARAKITQIVSQLKAEHRLCMTGTPLENHLGELWSLFNFLIPGYLGDEKQFRTLFRNPIEKGGEVARSQALARRVKPFILRRTKLEVATELPPKTEMIRMVEIDGSQRDLYETIRISMNEKVRAEIASRGLAKSHIIVLDALLKLRQVCCDPRLLKLEAAKKVMHSAKLEELMDMLIPMIEEGRKILLFSQFTSMLALISARLNEEKIEFVTLTGSTKDRETPIREFQAGKVPLFLISLKAGGVGLNLTAADTVIHYDPWWNPAAENQATDRAYRIGQDKPVFVYKMVTKGTVEEKILEMQARKQALADSLFDPTAKSAGKLDTKDIQALFEPIAVSAEG